MKGLRTGRTECECFAAQRLSVSQAALVDVNGRQVEARRRLLGGLRRRCVLEVLQRLLESRLRVGLAALDGYRPSGKMLPVTGSGTCIEGGGLP